jgi:hypothetical protein
MLKGRVVPVLGAGANLCDRKPGEMWRVGETLPTGAELARFLAERLGVDLADTSDLVRVSQYADITVGEGPLYDELRELFNHDTYPIPTLHRMLAGLPKLMRDNGIDPRFQLIVTTNYDNLLERALQEAGEPYDVVRYLTGERGRFLHEPSGPAGEPGAAGTAKLIKSARKYDAVTPDSRTVVLKIHGGFDRYKASNDSYVITEDDYIEYLTRTTPSDLIPVNLLETLLNSHFLFLGYAMRDWNLRVLLHRLWTARDRSWASWAVQLGVESFDTQLWRTRGVELREMALAEYVGGLSSSLAEAVSGWPRSAASKVA